MKNILYIDCFSGISGDMVVGAFLDLGLQKINISILRNQLKKLDISGYEIGVEKVKQGSLLATKFDVIVEPEQKNRNLKDIKTLINESNLDEKVKRLSIDVFMEIAMAESKIHGNSMDEIHFHEVGAVDSIIDIVSTAILYNCLNIDLVYSRKVPLGRGTAQAMHGRIPVPAPAALEILKGVPVYGGDFDFEVTTPTGAAIIKVLASEFKDIPEMTVKKVGLGAGKTEGSSIPNVLRLLYGSAYERSNLKVFYDKSVGNQTNFLEQKELILLSTNIDDCTPEIIGYLMGRLFKNKVLDAWAETIFMKKNRPAFKICVLCEPENLTDILGLIFSETTTTGIRAEEIKRFSLKRELKRVRLPYGEIKIKIASLGDKNITFSPEYDSCASLAEKTGKPLKEIYQDAVFFLSRK